MTAAKWRNALGTATTILLIGLPMIVVGRPTYDEDIDPFTGENNSRVVLSAEGAYFDEKVSIVWQCSADDLVVSLEHVRLSGDDDEVIVRTKIGDAAASEPRRYPLASSHHATQIDAADGRALTKGAVSADEIMIRIIDPGAEETLTSTFVTTNLRSVLARLACFP